MKILLIFGEDLYHYQKQILIKLLELKNLEIYLLSCNYKVKIPTDSRFLRLINEKFPVHKTDPYSFEKAADFIKEAEHTESFHYHFYYDYVINFCDETIITTFKIQFGSILKPFIDIRNWHGASINQNADTTIILLSSTNNKDFNRFKSMDFSTEIGTYNNRNKALYYFSYLVKSVFNGNSYTVAKSDKNDYNFLKNWTYDFKLLKIILLRKFSKAQFNWKIAVLENNSPRIITEKSGDFWADPFIIKEFNNNWVFFEELDRKTRLGKISVINLQKNKEFQKKVVLEKPYHLSFPNVFKLENDYFMMPEESESNEQNIYKATRFPYQWEKHKTIFKNIKIVDPVFIFLEGRYWLFFNKIENFEYENNERLYLYSSSDLFSDQWESHPQNPVVIDKTRARNAGKIIKENQDLIRVSQNCKITYGQNISQNKITHISREKYSEEKVFYTQDFNSFFGSHTLNIEGDLKVVDLLLKETK